MLPNRALGSTIRLWPACRLDQSRIGEGVYTRDLAKPPVQKPVSPCGTGSNGIVAATSPATRLPPTLIDRRDPSDSKRPEISAFSGP